MPIRAALRPTVLLVAAAVLLLAGCSAPGGTGGAAAPTAAVASAPADGTAGDDAGSDAAPVMPDDVCSLITAEEATEAYGGEITITDSGSSGCSYSGPSTGFLTSVSVIGGEDGWKIALAGLEAQTGSTPSIAGVGDRAAGTKGTIVVQQGATIFLVTASFADQDQDSAKAAAVAKVMAGRL